MIRAKFKCVTKEQNETGFIVKFHTVALGSKENEKFFKYTPFGELSMGTINAEAAAQIEPGKEYYLDISPAE